MTDINEGCRVDFFGVQEERRKTARKHGFDKFRADGEILRSVVFEVNEWVSGVMGG